MRCFVIQGGHQLGFDDHPRVAIAIHCGTDVNALGRIEPRLRGESLIEEEAYCGGWLVDVLELEFGDDTQQCRQVMEVRGPLVSSNIRPVVVQQSDLYNRLLVAVDILRIYQIGINQRSWGYRLLLLKRKGILRTVGVIVTETDDQIQFFLRRV